MNNETIKEPMSGYGVVVLCLVLLAATVTSFALQHPIPGVILFPVLVYFIKGFLIVYPNEASVLILFGTYKGTIKQSGFHWVNPLYLRRIVSLRARNLNGQSLKVNDKNGNPVEIAAVIVWQVKQESANAGCIL